MAPLDVASREYSAERKRLKDEGASAEDALEGARLVYRAAKVRSGIAKVGTWTSLGSRCMAFGGQAACGLRGRRLFVLLVTEKSKHNTI